MEARQAQLFAAVGAFDHWHYDLDEAVIEFSGPYLLLDAAR